MAESAFVWCSILNYVIFFVIGLSPCYFVFGQFFLFFRSNTVGFQKLAYLYSVSFICINSLCIIWPYSDLHNIGFLYSAF
jgi:hypothetical protein